MSEYQYYEFCNIHSPLTSEIRKAMASLSSRAQIGTHGASYVYNYGNFRGDPKILLLKHFDVFFYISKFGVIQLMFKYHTKLLDLTEIQKYCIKNLINCTQQNTYIVIELYLHKEEGCASWIEGEGLLPDLLPLYEELKVKNYKFLQLVAALKHKWMTQDPHALELIIAGGLSSAQKAFFNMAKNLLILTDSVIH